MEGFLESEWFQVVGITLITVFLGVFIKFSSRNDKHNPKLIEDVAIGFELMTTSIVLLLTYLGKKQVMCTEDVMELYVRADIHREMAVVFFGVCMCILFLIPGFTIVRKYGWQGKNKLNFGIGIVYQNIVGLIYLITALFLLKHY